VRLILAALVGLLAVVGVFAMATPTFSEAPVRVKWIYGVALLVVVVWLTYYAFAYLGIPQRVWIFGGTNT
jgi:hypothetical protein